MSAAFIEKISRIAMKPMDAYEAVFEAAEVIPRVAELKKLNFIFIGKSKNLISGSLLLVIGFSVLLIALV